MPVGNNIPALTDKKTASLPNQFSIFAVGQDNNN